MSAKRERKNFGYTPLLKKESWIKCGEPIIRHEAESFTHWPRTGIGLGLPAAAADRSNHPPRIEATTRRLTVIVAGQTVAATSTAWRVLETSHPPVYYFPPADVDTALLRPVDGSTSCEWKGQARYFDIVVRDTEGRQIIRPRAAWSYPQPTAESTMIRNCIAFYAGLADLCTVDGQPVIAQPGGFYGGWITPDLVGPFKGGPGTLGW